MERKSTLEYDPNLNKYLPPTLGTMRRYFYDTFMSLAYNVWKKEIIMHSGVQQKMPLAILECGCGPGYLLKKIQESFPNAKIVGLDMNLFLLEKAHPELTRLPLVRGSAENLPFLDCSFNVVIALHLIEHLRKPKEFIEEAKRILQKRGIFILATPNPVGLAAKLMGKRWQGFKDNTHYSVNTPEQWKRALEENGFTILREGTTGISALPYLKMTPFILLNWILLYIFGYFPWDRGETYICIARSI